MSEPPAQEVEIAEVANLAIVVENNVQIHQHRHTHLHIETSPKPQRPKANPERIRPEISRHEAKVIELQEFFCKMIS